MDELKTGTYKDGPASLRLSFSQMVPPHLRGKCRELTSLEVDPDWRGKGYATALLLKTLNLADAEGTTLLLHVEPYEDSPLDEERLATWYAKYGFKEIQAMPRIMARPPQQALNG